MMHPVLIYMGVQWTCNGFALQCAHFYCKISITVAEGSLSTLVQPRCVNRLYSDLVECLISARAAYVRYSAEAKVISIFSPVTLLNDILAFLV